MANYNIVGNLVLNFGVDLTNMQIHTDVQHTYGVIFVHGL